MGTLAQEYDCLLLDLDGTVFRGHELTEGAAESLEKATSRKLFVTNNASRSADEVAGHLNDIGLEGDRRRCRHQRAKRRPRAGRPTGARVAGADRRHRLAGSRNRCRRPPAGPPASTTNRTPWSRATPRKPGGPTSPRRRWPSGPARLWVAANVDRHPAHRTRPAARQRLDGRRAKAATDAEPQVAGKPSPTLMRDALARGDFRTPLVVGDRLNTDIAGANAAGLPSLMVLTGVNSARDAVHAVPRTTPDIHRPRPTLAARGRRRARGGRAIGDGTSRPRTRR